MHKFSNINKMSINSISSFMNINGRFDGMAKDSYFLRYIGYDDEKNYISEISNADKFMREKINNKIAGYLRLSKLNKKSNDIKYEYICQNYMNTKNINGLNNAIPDIIMGNLNSKFEYILGICKEIGFKDIKNLIEVLFYWIDIYFPELFLSNFDYRTSPKFIFTGRADIYEYIFLYFLALNGCDVLCLNSEADFELSEELLSLSRQVKFKNFKYIDVFEYKNLVDDTSQNYSESKNISENGNIKIKLNLTRPDRKRNNSNIQNSNKNDIQNNGRVENNLNNQMIQNQSNEKNELFGISIKANDKYKIDTSKYKKENVRRLLDYEELALLSSSVVMIEVYDDNNEFLHLGSGVMIGENGYIITNFHVVSKGSKFRIIIENDDNTYIANQVLKYHQNFDLAVIKIDKKLKPMRLYRQKEKLVRGQKVVAIGSQLGLFNSISEGIIGGFRKFEHTSVIQFTAPTLGGNSGGALLNMYGELIGIIFAGPSESLNLAIDYETIYLFAKGFLDC